MTDRELMQMALDALELVDGYVMGKHEAKEALREALAAKEPEPVGYYYNGRFSTEKNSPGIGVYGVPLYTAPPQREWQGLTDKEIENCFEMSMFGTCRAIEAKLKEKNAPNL